MSTAIVKINGADYGLEESKAKQISDMFKPMLDEMVSLEKEYNEIAKLDMSRETCAKAKELRLKYVYVRTGTDKIHKELKRFYLDGGRFVDGWKTAQIHASSGIEGKLKDIEKHYENIEIERVETLQKSRALLLTPYIEEELIPTTLGTMSEDIFSNFLTGTKTNHQAKIDAEKKVENERIAKEKADKEERERIEKENALLKKQAEEAEAAKRLAQEKHQAEAKLAAEKAAELKKELDAKLQKVKDEEERKRKQAEAVAKEAEAIAKKASDELAAKKAEEEKIAKEKADELETFLNRNDEEKVKDLINDLVQLKTKYEFKSKKNQQMYENVHARIDSVIELIG